MHAIVFSHATAIRTARLILFALLRYIAAVNTTALG
jgi:hypothetical protein